MMQRDRSVPQIRDKDSLTKEACELDESHLECEGCQVTTLRSETGTAALTKEACELDESCLECEGCLGEE